jgi:Rhodopirellula transposase DDE domain
MDTKAVIKVGPFSRGGYNRYGLRAWDHDFEPVATLKLFGISIPETDETFFYFTESYATSDFMVDALEHLWPTIKEKYNPHTIVLNMDNGPENNSRRSQFMKRKKGVRLTKAAMNKIENLIHRVSGIEKWAVDILCYNE